MNKSAGSVYLTSRNTILSVAFVIVRHTFRVEIVMRSTTRSKQAKQAWWQHMQGGGKNKRAFLALKISLPPCCCCSTCVAVRSPIPCVRPSTNDLNQRGLFRSGGWLWTTHRDGGGRLEQRHYHVLGWTLFMIFFILKQHSDDVPFLKLWSFPSAYNWWLKFLKGKTCLLCPFVESKKGRNEFSDTWTLMNWK